ncbi:hypothetical protein [Desertibacillus haloalkaliphilus]|uniref:hypothetical protein n=1 Tax=Desertibacillus haloalkaliphilus TaxID=1328930 RepID=UPI001C271CBB|nr:hypothetical protein [Desertibacillus haloalkaliphilus]MBU8906380.1 hypothetical protein [Desertibacillus haloalkaliphilus]
MMRKYRHQTNIHHLSINHARGGSINFGPSIHKGHQANSKFVAGEYIIGDEFNICCPPKENENDEETNSPIESVSEKAIEQLFNEEDDNEESENNLKKDQPFD